MKNYDKDLDLLLVDGINHYILIKDINKFISNNSHIIKSCRNCLNSFYSLDKYKFHIEYCNNRKPKKLLPSFKKYMQIENLLILKTKGFHREGYDGSNDLENIDIISGASVQPSGGSIKIIQNTRLVVKISECQLFSAGNSKEIDKIPEQFFKKRNLIIMKNLNDNKCLLFSYIRKHLNPITVNPSRISKKDIEISKELIDEFNIDFENVSIGEIDEIANFLECNIHVFGCNENLNNKKIIRKSLKNYDKDLGLLLLDNINHFILIKDINKFISNSHVVKSCKNCLNSFYSLDKYNFHIEYLVQSICA